VGVILIGGLNPPACVQEAAFEVEHLAMSTVMEYRAMKPFDELIKGI
jgi:repressor of nif and glnA expression